MSREHAKAGGGETYLNFYGGLLIIINISVFSICLHLPLNSKVYFCSHLIRLDEAVLRDSFLHTMILLKEPKEFMINMLSDVQEGKDKH